MDENPNLTDKKLINVIRQLRQYGPTTTDTGRPCLYDIRKLLGQNLSAQACIDMDVQIHRLLSAGEILGFRGPRRLDRQSMIYLHRRPHE